MRSTDIDSLVFSGGGVQGVSFCGVLLALESFFASCDENVHPYDRFKTATGASIGALFAVAISIRVSGTELFQLLETDMGLATLVPFLDFTMLHNMWGCDNGNQLRQCISRVIRVGLDQKRWGARQRDPDAITLAELFALTGTHLIISVTRLGSLDGAEAPRVEYLSHETAGHMAVVDAVAMSMTLPLLFCPVTFRNGVYVDGGVMDNVPTVWLDKDKTIVFRLDNPPLSHEGGLSDYLTAVLAATSCATEAKKLEEFSVVNIKNNRLGHLSFHASRRMVVETILLGMTQTFAHLHKEDAKRITTKTGFHDDDLVAPEGACTRVTAAELVVTSSNNTNEKNLSQPPTNNK